MGERLEDLQEAARWISDALRSSGCDTDFSPSSAWEIERFMEENAQDGEAVAGGLLAEDMGPRLFVLGGYLGELLRRSVGGRWQPPRDEQDELGIESRQQDGALVWPIERVVKRFKNGPEDSLVAYCATAGLDVGAEPPVP
ncbi:MAG: hypothetical protein GY711_35095 [bacterium]|nr:hypothetical protein [bacterium]